MKRVLVTGGHRRLGRALSLGLAASGYDLVIHYRRDTAAAEKTVCECRELGVSAESLQGDFSHRDGVAGFIGHCKARFPRLCGIVHNVGLYLATSLRTLPLGQWEEIFQVNLNAPMAITQAYLEGLIAERGCVIHIGSHGLTTPRASSKRNAYNISKHALWHLTRAWAHELAADGVRCHMVSPGHLENSIDLPQRWPEGSMGRPGTCDEVVKTVLFLMDVDQRYLTGQNVEVAGGVGL